MESDDKLKITSLANTEKQESSACRVTFSCLLLHSDLIFWKMGDAALLLLRRNLKGKHLCILFFLENKEGVKKKGQKEDTKEEEECNSPRHQRSVERCKNNLGTQSNTGEA